MNDKARIALIVAIAAFVIAGYKRVRAGDRIDNALMAAGLAAFALAFLL